MKSDHNIVTCSEADAIIQIAHTSTVSEQAALARPLAALVEAALQAASKSAHTLRAYQTAIGLFLRYLDDERGALLPPALADWRPFAQTVRIAYHDSMGRARTKTGWEYRGAAAALRLIDATTLDGFVAWRAAEGDGLNTQATRLAAVRVFLRVAYRDGVLTNEQAAALDINPYRARQKRDEKPVGRRLSRAEVRALRDTVEAGRVKGKRDLAILDALLFLGLRREEVARMRTGDFRQDGGRWWVLVRGKGGKSRRLKLHDTLYRSLADWLEALGLAKGEGDAPVFCSLTKGGAPSGAIYASTIGRIVAEYGYQAGIAAKAGANRLSPHDLRRTMARNAYDNGASLLQVQQWLGHSDPKTTARYIGAYQQDDDMAVDYLRY